MSESEITDVTAWEVLDSRGHPTVRCEVTTPEGSGRFTVPAGASTGRFEAVERRDGGDRYDGLGVTEAVSAVEGTLADAVVGRDVTDQAGIDAALERADGTDRFAVVGANAALAVSGAVLHAASAATGRPLYRHLAENHGVEPSMPTPMVNVIPGGLHARGGIEIQDFLAVPTRADSCADALETAWEVRDAVRARMLEDGHRPLVAAEGGFAPPMDAVDEAFDLLVTSSDRLSRAIDRDLATAVLVNPNQAGTITRALTVVADAREGGMEPVVSARSGETCDATIADLAVGLDAGQIKVGSLARSERLAKYNRLLGIERTADLDLRRPLSS